MSSGRPTGTAAVEIFGKMKLFTVKVAAFVRGRGLFVFFFLFDSEIFVFFFRPSAGLLWALRIKYLFVSFFSKKHFQSNVLFYFVHGRL